MSTPVSYSTNTPQGSPRLAVDGTEPEPSNQNYIATGLDVVDIAQAKKLVEVLLRTLPKTVVTGATRPLLEGIQAGLVETLKKTDALIQTFAQTNSSSSTGKSKVRAKFIYSTKSFHFCLQLLYFKVHFT